MTPPDVHFDDLLLVMVVAVLVPLLLGLVPRVPIPSSVLEIAAGILIGPAVLDWVKDDSVINVFAKLGVALLLFLAGLELDFDKLRGRPLRIALWGFVASLALGLVIAAPLAEFDVIINPLLITIILASTSLGIVAPVLKDAGVLDTKVGVYVIASCTVAEFGSIVVLSMFFTRSGSADPIVTLVKLGVLGLVVALIAVLSVRRGSWRHRVDEVVFRLQDTSSQLRLRIAMLLLIALLVVSQELKFDAILGAFLAGALLSALTDPARDEEFGHVRHKLEGIGFGFFVPIFFVATGLSFPVDQLFSDASTAVRVPVFLAMLLAVRGIPALLFRHRLPGSTIFPSALLQATSLSFIVVAAQIGVEVHELRPVNAASLVAAGMLSVLLFPAGALALLRRGRGGDDPEPESDETVIEGV